MKAHRGPLAWLALVAVLVGSLATHRWQPASPHLPLTLAYAVSGDEPHYLLMVHSVLFDGDLRLQNNYAAARSGGPEAGRWFSGVELDPHALLVSRTSREAFRWRELYAPIPTAAPDPHGFAFEPRRPNPLPPGTYDLTPAHSPALALVIATLLWPWDLPADQVESAFGIAILAFALAALLAAYGAGIAAGLAPRESVLAVALFALCSPWLVYTRSFYPAMPVSLLTLLALWAHLRDRSWVAALLLAVATWFMPPCALFGMAWILQRLWQRRLRDAFVLAAVQGASGLLLIAFNRIVSGVPVIAGTRGMHYDFAPGQLLQILFDPGFGLALFAPWVLLALAEPFRRGAPALSTSTRATVLLPLATYLMLMLGYRSLGSSYGPRYWIFVLPWFAILAVAWARRRGPLAFGILALCALGGALCALPAVMQYWSEIWGRPPTAALLRMFDR